MRHFVIPPSKQDFINKVNKLIDKELEKFRVDLKIDPKDLKRKK